VRHHNDPTFRRSISGNDRREDVRPRDDQPTKARPGRPLAHDFSSAQPTRYDIPFNAINFCLNSAGLLFRERKLPEQLDEFFAGDAVAYFRLFRFYGWPSISAELA
jgi:hypothetical protein